jgi:uncharacterized protein YbcI
VETRNDPSLLAAVSRAMVSIHKEQFGRGPTKVRTYFAGPDVLITLFEDALLPAEKAMVEMGEGQRVQESRLFLQEATKHRFVQAVEQLVYRKVRSFQSSCDPSTGVVTEVSIFEPAGAPD